ncbi:hypothetical protein [Roseisolibacter agri]|uniref:Uncharacterized protein n=1 Tax=Roseisolibacter agri TaxID=2014610 RepID=A0AA37QJ59_9BACT|nr:hypothetical protein [Roseisolibacter agri]GLC26783.1 hypothetical protein rosag_32960 [Roseisolibacter agri]
MSALVLRCPNCGSVQDDEGTCETCHEADVRLFCPNHVPGRWLDAPRCDACGATRDAGPIVVARPPAPPPPFAPPPAEPPPPRRVTRRDPMSVPPIAPDWRPTTRPHAPPRTGPVVPDVIPPAVRVALPSFLGCMGRLVMVVLFLLALLLAGFVYVVWY